MLAIIASILSSTLGLVLNKVRNKATDKLKDGDVTKEKLRDKIIEDLNDIKTKIDGLSRKDLLSSYCFLKEGLGFLNLAVDESNNEPKYEENVAQVGGSQTTTTATAPTQSTTEYGVLNEALALSNAIQKLKNTSSSRLMSAKERFKASREEATRAFCNEALTIQDRIMAAKLRVVSSILESLQNTKAAAISCMMFLEELHNLPAIRDIFSAYFKGEIKSWVFKASRLENVKSVLSLNFAISEFIARFSGQVANVRNWPKIYLSKKGETIHPLILEPNVVKKIFEDTEIRFPENHVHLPTTDYGLRHWGINSKGQLIATSSSPCLFTFNRSGRKEIFCQLRKATAIRLGGEQQPKSLAIDRYDNVYVIISLSNDKPLHEKIYVLFVFDSRGNKQSESVLSFVEETRFINCVVTNERDIIIHFSEANHYYVCDSNGVLKSSVPLEHSANYCLGDFISLECITNQNEMIMLARKNGINHVLVYTIEGKLKREIKVDGRVLGVTYDYVNSQIQVLTEKFSAVSKNNRYIYYYSETDDDYECLYLGRASWQALPLGILSLALSAPKLVSHLDGATAYLSDNYVFFGDVAGIFM